jgi:hypothetical protein
VVEANSTWVEGQVPRVACRQMHAQATLLWCRSRRRGVMLMQHMCRTTLYLYV